MSKHLSDEERNIVIVMFFSLFYRAQMIYRDIHIDEAFTYFFSKMPYEYIINNDVHPLLSYFIFKPWSNLIGNNIELLRLMPLVIWVIFAYVAYQLARENLGKNAAFYLLIFLSFSPTIAYYSTQYRMYILALLFLACNFLFFFRLMRKHEERHMILYHISTIAMMLTHLFTIPIALLQAFVIIIKRRATKTYNWFIITYMLYAAYLTIHILKNLGRGDSFHFIRPTIDSLVSTYAYMFSPPSASSGGIFVFIILVSILAYHILKPKMTRFEAFCVAVLLIPMAMFPFLRLMNIYHHRLFIFFGFGGYLLLASVTGRIHKQHRRGKNDSWQHAIVGAYLAIMLMSFPFMGFAEHDTAMNMAALNIPIIHQYPSSYLPYKFYHEDLKGVADSQNLLLTNQTASDLYKMCGSVISGDDIIHTAPPECVRIY
jgi:uncharacterized membrane protein